ncbi:Msx2-interacting protein [Dirofilaria immitis]|nr:Msx2-interacting protein [Dirofilaria immitis]
MTGTRWKDGKIELLHVHIFGLHIFKHTLHNMRSCCAVCCDLRDNMHCPSIIFHFSSHLCAVGSLRGPKIGFGRVQKVERLDATSFVVSFMDVRSAQKAHSMEPKFQGHQLRIAFHEQSKKLHKYYCYCEESELIAINSATAYLSIWLTRYRVLA